VKTAALFALLLVLSACSGSPPEILFVDRSLHLVADPAESSPREALRVFVAAEDEDGPQDISRVLIVHEESEILWDFDEASWQVIEYGGDRWYGHSDLELPNSERVPRGRFTIVVEDAAGNSVESEFFLSAPLADFPIQQPFLEQEGGDVFLRAASAVVLRAYTRSGDLVLTQSLEPGRMEAALRSSLADLDGRVLFLYQRSAGQEELPVISGPFPVTPRSQ
jgi:hypothetical protein